MIRRPLNEDRPAPVIKKECRTCKHWERIAPEKGRKDFGICHRGILRDTHWFEVRKKLMDRDLKSNMLLYWDKKELHRKTPENEGEFYTGESFGCIHHKIGKKVWRTHGLTPFDGEVDELRRFLINTRWDLDGLATIVFHGSGKGEIKWRFYHYEGKTFRDLKWDILSDNTVLWNDPRQGSYKFYFDAGPKKFIGIRDSGEKIKGCILKE